MDSEAYSLPERRSPGLMSLEEQELLDEIYFYQERLAEIGEPTNSYQKMMQPVYHSLLQKNKKQLASCTYRRIYSAA